jgi:hypothetical protein
MVRTGVGWRTWKLCCTKSNDSSCLIIHSCVQLSDPFSWLMRCLPLIFARILCHDVGTWSPTDDPAVSKMVILLLFLSSQSGSWVMKKKGENMRGERKYALWDENRNMSIDICIILFHCRCCRMADTFIRSFTVWHERFN